MKPSLRVVFIISVFLLSFLSASYAQFGNETITITTYYPSPHGVYGILRLYPRETPPDEENSLKGDLYYDLGSEDPYRPEGVYVYNGTNWTITSIGGTGGDGSEESTTPEGEPITGVKEIVLAEPLQEKFDPLTIPATSTILCRPSTVLHDDEKRYEAIGPWTDLSTYSFTIDRSSINATIEGRIVFSSDPSYPDKCCSSCNCATAQILLDGKPIYGGDRCPAHGCGDNYITSDMKFTTTEPLSMGSHTLIFQWQPRSEEDRWGTYKCDCLNNKAQFRGGKLSFVRTIDKIVVSDGEYQ